MFRFVLVMAVAGVLTGCSHGQLYRAAQVVQIASTVASTYSSVSQAQQRQTAATQTHRSGGFRAPTLTEAQRRTSTSQASASTVRAALPGQSTTGLSNNGKLAFTRSDVGQMTGSIRQPSPRSCSESDIEAAVNDIVSQGQRLSAGGGIRRSNEVIAQVYGATALVMIEVVERGCPVDVAAYNQEIGQFISLKQQAEFNVRQVSAH